MPTLYRTYRPQTFAEVTAQEHIKKTLQNQLKTGNVAHAYLFTGPRGIGKTTVARLLAKAINCEKWQPQSEGKGKPFEPCNECQMCIETTNGSALDVFEIDAASHTGVDNVRELIDGVRFSPNKGRFKVYIIDEVHMLSTAAFNALLKTLEEPPAHAIFILATTEIHKVPATVISRCQRFDFRRFTPTETVERLKIIVKAEKIKVDEEVLYEIARHSEGCERDAESLLGQLLALGEKEIDVKTASLVLPMAYTDTVLNFVEQIFVLDSAAAIRLLNEGVEQGMDVPSFLDNVISLLRTLLFIKLGGLERFQESHDAASLKRLVELAKKQTGPAFANAIELFLAARRGAKNETIPQLGAELAVIKIVSPTVVISSVGPIGNNSVAEKEVKIKKEIVSTPENIVENIVTSTKIVEAEIELIPPSLSMPTRSIDLNEVRAKWDTLCERLEDKNPSLLLILKNGDIARINGNQIEVNFEYALHSEMVNRGKNKKNIDDTFSEILGTPVSVMAIHVQREVVADEAVNLLTEAFGGQAI